MATTGKKAKKNKWKTLDPTLIINTSALPVKPLSWAEESEIEEREQSMYTGSRPAQNIVLPSAPRASIDADVYERTVPYEGPFMAYLSNLSFDIAEDEIYEFFEDLKVARVDLPRDDRSGSGGRCKGYGHVEFEDRASLISALGFIDASIKGRRVRIDLPNAQDERQNRGGNQERRQYRDRNNQDRERPEREETSGDWRSAPRAEAQERRKPYGDRDSYNRDDRGGGGRSPRRGGFRSEDGPATMTRDDFGTAKPTPLPERSRGGFTERSAGGGGGGRSFDRSEMKDPSQAASPERERERDITREREFTRERPSRDTGRSFDRTEMRERPKDTSPPSEPKTRPKLNLAPRTKPIETPPPLPQPPLDTPEEKPTPPPPPAPKPSAVSIFGGAKPVDTAARERAIEEKLKAKATAETDQEASRSRETSPSPLSKDNKESDAPSPPENVWAKRSQQLNTNSNITNGTSPDSAAEDASPESQRPAADDSPAPLPSDNSATDTESRLPAPSENDENRQPLSGNKDRESSGGWREGGPRRERDDRGPRRDFGGPPRDSRDNKDNRGDNRGFRNNEDREKRPMNRDNRDRDGNNRDRDNRGPPRRNFDHDRPVRQRDGRGADDTREIRRNPNNTRDNEIKRGGGRPGAPNKDGPQAPASTGPQGPPAQADSAKPKPKKSKEVDITKMPKVQESKGINFAQGNKFSLLPDEEGEEVDKEDENI